MSDNAVTAANVRPTAGKQVYTALAGAALTAGQMIYLNRSTSPLPTANLADANGGSVGDVTRNVDGVTTCSAAVGQPVTYSAGDPTFTTGATLVKGTTVYLSQTPGGITSTLGDLGSGSTVISVGDVNTDLTLNFAPRKGGEVA